MTTPTRPAPQKKKEPNFASLAELRAMSEDDLVSHFDDAMARGAANLSGISQVGAALGPNDFLAELHRREQDKQTEEMLQLTRDVRNMTDAIKLLTILVAAMTAVNLVLVAVSLFE